MTDSTNSTDKQAESPRRPYQAPAIKVMDEDEVLKAFQITSAGMSWWG